MSGQPEAAEGREILQVGIVCTEALHVWRRHEATTVPGPGKARGGEAGEERGTRPHRALGAMVRR